MRLYCTTIGQWAGTQADARLFKATHGVDFEQIDVPTDKTGLLAFLNAREVPAHWPTEEIRAESDIGTPTSENLRPEPVEISGADDCEAFIFDRATPAEIERLFTALGARFHEMRKAAQ